MTAYNVEIVTPIRELNLQDVSYLRCPGLDGSFGIMNDHREGIFALSVGEIKVSQGGKNEYYATGGGFAEIFNNSCSKGYILNIFIKPKLITANINVNPKITPNIKGIVFLNP